MYKEYKVLFDQNCPQWTGNNDYDVLYLKSQILYWQDIFMSRGYLFLRDVYEDLGIRLTRNIIGAGWHFGSESPHISFIRKEDKTFEITFSYVHDNIAEFFEEP